MTLTEVALLSISAGRSTSHTRMTAGILKIAASFSKVGISVLKPR